MSPTEGFYVDLSLRQKNGHLAAPISQTKIHKSNKSISLGRNDLALYSSNYKNLIILGDFNAGIGNSYIGGFYDTYDLQSLITEPTCNKTPESPTCIDLLVTSHPRCFHNFCVF